MTICHLRFPASGPVHRRVGSSPACVLLNIRSFLDVPTTFRFFGVGLLVAPRSPRMDCSSPTETFAVPGHFARSASRFRQCCKIYTLPSDRFQLLMYTSIIVPCHMCLTLRDGRMSLDGHILEDSAARCRNHPSHPLAPVRRQSWRPPHRSRSNRSTRERAHR